MKHKHFPVSWHIFIRAGNARSENTFNHEEHA